MKLQLKIHKSLRLNLAVTNIIIVEEVSASAIEKATKFISKALKLRIKEAIRDAKKTDCFVKCFTTTEGGSVAIVASSTEAKLSKIQSALKTELRSSLAKKTSKECLIFIESEKSLARLEEICMLSHLVRWKYPKRKTAQAKPNEDKSTLKFQVKSKLDPKKIKAAVHRGEALGRSACLVKTLSNMPANFLTPELFRKEIESLAKKHNWKHEFLNETKLNKLSAGAFTAVSQGSSNRDAGLSHLTIKPKGGKSLAKIAFVGKGICFDTGGYNIKPGTYMFDMHKDMTGAATALSLGLLVHELSLPIETHVYLALAENHVSPEAFKMNEVVYASNGKSIEVIHTDAEGRMVLSDTLAIASKDKPDLMFDYATLTGSAIRSVGVERACVFSNKQRELLSRSFEATENSGEKVWPFPVGEEYEEGLKSKVADLKQCDQGSNADHIYAATFLQHFVDPQINWVHMDLSPVDGKGVGLLPFDGAGFGLKWSLSYLESFLKSAAAS